MEEGRPLNLSLPAQFPGHGQKIPALKGGNWEIRVAGSKVHQDKRSKIRVEV